MLGPTAIVAAFLALAADDRPPPHAYYVRDNHPLTPALAKAQDACAEEAFRKVKDSRGRYDPAQYDTAIRRCISERNLWGGPSPQLGQADPTEGTGNAQPQVVDSRWMIDGYKFGKYPGFDEAGDLRPDRPPAPAEVAAIKRCLALASTRSVEVAAAFINRCLTDLGHAGIFLVAVPPLSR